MRRGHRHPQNTTRPLVLKTKKYSYGNTYNSFYKKEIQIEADKDILLPQIMQFCAVDTFFGDGYTCSSGKFEFDGFLCRGGLPECRWMSVPEAFFLQPTSIK